MTKYIFIDESGCNGFSKKGSSRYLIIAALVVEDLKPLKKIIKHLRTKEFKKELSKAKEIKAVSSSDKLRLIFIEKIITLEKFEIHYIYVNKNKVTNKKLKKDSNLFYDTVASELAKNICFENENIEVIIDNSKINSCKRNEFNKLFSEKIYHNSTLNKFTIEHKDSQSIIGLQFVDLIGWSIYQKYEFENNKYYTKLKNIYSYEFLE